ncbi:spore germination protein GerPE [Bacillus sp. FJAT-49736]|uniref:spore germination protein GerPE n=1 Tax=Bacillus sp. FJAT-49736 TaxID=2833582 RepID=UPI001BC8FB99|nr:spore germination protein GerPE [Bacillus sp. FJAT-49736]MBS4172009.1 spore germination protein GerPE [Bacillus sp. FJAT-49736]
MDGIRNSVVQDISINDVVFSSNVHVGDTTYIKANSRAFAVQREEELYFGFEVDFEDYPIFSEVIPIPPITEDIHFHRINLDPVIRVDHINIIGISAASIFQIGSIKDAYLESRVHHVRQLKEKPES